MEGKEDLEEFVDPDLASNLKSDIDLALRDVMEQRDRLLKSEIRRLEAEGVRLDRQGRVAQKKELDSLAAAVQFEEQASMSRQRLLTSQCADLAVMKEQVCT